MRTFQHPDNGDHAVASGEAAEMLLEEGWAEIFDGDTAAETPAAAADGEKKIGEMTGKELDALAAELGIPDWNAKAKVPAKRDALTAHIETADHGGPGADPNDLDTLTDDELAAKAVELDIDVVDADSNPLSRDEILAAIRAA